MCSGIEAATVAWHPLGWEPVAFSEIEPFPCAVLEHHYPDTPNLGDMERFGDWRLRDDPDVLVGGTPCQSFSVAGLRRGLADPRGNLTLVYLAIAERYRPEWLVWENVPGVLSTDGGRAFGALLGGLEKLGYGWSYRTLDAQYFGLAQRRKRVFVIGSARGWAAAAAVLFEPACLRGDSPPSREARPDVAGSLTQGLGSRGGVRAGADEAAAGHIIAMAHGQGGAEITEDGTGPTLTCNHEAPIAALPFDTTQITHRENRSRPEPGDPSPTLAPNAQPPAIAFSAKDYGADAGELAPTLRAMGHDGSHANAGGQLAVAHSVCLGSDPIHQRECAMPHTTRNGDPGAVQYGMLVRRLTPRECERLQGFPDDYTLIPTEKARKVEADWLAYMRRTYPNMGEAEARRLSKDGPRYKALGNSFAVPVIEWIGRRIALFEEAVA